MQAKLFYDTTADKYDERHDTPRIQYMRRVESRIIKKFASGRILDIGCGTGEHMKYADAGIDVSSAMLNQAKRKGFDSLIQSKAEHLPFKDESFDSVVCMFTVINMCDCKKVVGEMYRILKKGGIIIISVASVWDHSRKNIISRILSGKKSHILRMRIEKFRFNFFVFAKKDLIELFTGFRLMHFYGAFILANTYWGWYRDFTVIDRVKLKIAFGLERFLQPFNKASRMYFAVFQKL